MPGIKYLFAWHYPPVFHLAVLPLALLPYLWSYALWAAGTLALYLAVLRRLVPGPYTVWLLLAFPAAFLNVMHGQNGFITVALLAGAVMTLERRPWLAGLFIGLLCYKPQLGLLLPLVLLAGRHWIAFLSAALTTGRAGEALAAWARTAGAASRPARIVITAAKRGRRCMPTFLLNGNPFSI